jgi:hypothetical protein
VQKIEIQGIVVLNEQDPYEPTGVLIFDPISESTIRLLKTDNVCDFADFLQDHLKIQPGGWDPTTGRRAKITIEWEV